MSASFNHVALACADIDASAAFYAEYARMEIMHARTDPTSRVVWLGDLTQEFVIVLAQGPDPSTTLGDFAHFGISCDSRDAVDAAAARAARDGCLAAGPKQSGDLYWAYIRDPDGHQLEVSYGGESISEAVRAARARKTSTAHDVGPEEK